MGSVATKYVNSNLINFDPQGKIRIRFSLMPQSRADIHEPGTSKIIDRIKAIDAFIDAVEPGALDLTLTPPAPPPPDASPLKSPYLPDAPLPATTKYSTLFDPAELPTLETQKVPSAVNI